MAGTINLQDNIHVPSPGELAFLNDPSQLIIRGSAYLIALLLFLREFSRNAEWLFGKIIFLFFVTYILMSGSWSDYPIKVFINWGHQAGVALSVMVAALYFMENEESVYRFVAYISGIGLAVSLVAIMAFPSIGLNYDGRWQGLTGNPNTLGVICVVSIWANMAVFLSSERGRIPILNLALLILSLVLLFGAGSRTSMVVGLFVILAMPFLVGMERNAILIRKFKAGMLVYLGLLLVSLLQVVMPDVLTFDGSMKVVGRETNLSGRIGLWELALQEFYERPVLGWSFDSNMTVLKHMSDINIGQFHNGYIDVLVRGGMVGLMFLLLFLARIYFMVGEKKKVDYRNASIFLVLFLAVLLHNISEASFVRGAHILWILMMFSYFYLDADSCRGYKKCVK